MKLMRTSVDSRLRRSAGALLWATLLVSTMATAQQQSDAPTVVERDIHTVEIGRVNGVNGAPVSITIDNRAYAVTEEIYVDGSPLKGDNNAMAKTLRRLVGRDVGYGWYQTPGHQPVVVNIMPFKAEKQ
ncbi:MAG: hypothetical protein HYS20_00800 [Rhodocyclales bacterium]|nr:hypothetical protein [Rhodocyclales bacterium]